MAVKWTAGWALLMAFALRLAAADASSFKPIVLTFLSAGATGSSIQHALDALPASGGEVFLAAGHYEISQPIVLQRDNQILRGAGPATVLHLADKANCPVIIMGEPVNTPTRTVRHLEVTGFSIDGNRFHQLGELWHESGEGSQIRNNGITVQGVADSTIENVSITRCRSGGLVTTRDVRRLTVRGLDSSDNQFDGLACYETENCLFTDLRLHDNPAAGISMDLAFNHNVISNALLVANDLGIFMRSSSRNQFLNVIIRNSHHYGVFMAHTDHHTASGWEPAPKSECTMNAFTNITAMNCGGAAFRVNNTTCTNNVIVRAKFDNNLKGGLSLVQPNLLTIQ